MFYRCLLTLVVAMSVLGCETPDTIGSVTYRPYDREFRKFVLTWDGTFGGSKTDIYLLRLQNGGKLEICGFYVKSLGTEEDLTVEWLKYAKILINGAEIVSTKFLRPQERVEGAKSNCVVTTTKFTNELKTGALSLEGRNVRLSY